MRTDVLITGGTRRPFAGKKDTMGYRLRRSFGYKLHLDPHLESVQREIQPDIQRIPKGVQGQNNYPGSDGFSDRRGVCIGKKDSGELKG